jgi:hypothetical protein
MPRRRWRSAATPHRCRSLRLTPAQIESVALCSTSLWEGRHPRSCLEVTDRRVCSALTADIGQRAGSSAPCQCRGRAAVVPVHPPDREMKSACSSIPRDHPAGSRVHAIASVHPSAKARRKRPARSQDDAVEGCHPIVIAARPEVEMIKLSHRISERVFLVAERNGEPITRRQHGGVARARRIRRLLVCHNCPTFSHMSVAEKLAFGLRMRRIDGNEMERQVEGALKQMVLDRFKDGISREGCLAASGATPRRRGAESSEPRTI